MVYRGTLTMVTKQQGVVIATIEWYIEPTPPYLGKGSADVTVPADFEQAFFASVGKSVVVGVDAQGTVTSLTVKA